jgi:hypothetical protein
MADQSAAKQYAIPIRLLPRSKPWPKNMTVKRSLPSSKASAGKFNWEAFYGQHGSSIAEWWQTPDISSIISNANCLRFIMRGHQNAERAVPIRCLRYLGAPHRLRFVAALKQLNRDRRPVLRQVGAWRWVMPSTPGAEISRGKIAFILNRTPAGFTTPALDGIGVCDSHARSSCRVGSLSGSRPSGRGFAPRFFQTPAHGDALALH